MSETDTYLFAVAASTQFGPRIALPGLPDEFGPVRPVVVDDVVALVSTYSGPAIQDFPQNELVRRLVLHQTVIEYLMQRDSVLPVRLGTVLDDDAVTRLLQAQGELIGAAWEQYRDAVEIDIAATWKLEETLAELAQDPEVMAAKAAAVSVPAGSPTDAVLDVGKLVEAKLNERRVKVESQVLEALRPHVRDLQLNQVVSDELVCNFAALVGKTSLVAFDEALHQRDVELEGRYLFRRVGPLPPYSFATVHVQRIGLEAIDAAQAMFELPASFDEVAVLDRYRSLALVLHPDVRRTDPHAPLRFEDLNRARSVLLAVCRNRIDATRIPASPVLYASVERSVGRN